MVVCILSGRPCRPVVELSLISEMKNDLFDCVKIKKKKKKSIEKIIQVSWCRA